MRLRITLLSLRKFVILTLTLTDYDKLSINKKVEKAEEEEEEENA